MGKSTKNEAPDYQGAAREQAASSKEVTNMQTWANRPELSTPWGKQSWSSWADVDPATGQPVTRWGSQITLAPEQQASLDSQMAIGQGRSDLALGMMGRVADEYGQPLDYSKMPTAATDIAGEQQKAYDLMSKLFEPGRTQQQSAMDARLRAMGVDMGSEAYKRQSANLGEQFGRQNMQAAVEAMNQGRAQAVAQNQLRQGAIAEALQRRGTSLNELNALLTGQQVSMPQMPGFSQAQAAQPLQALTAANLQGQYGLQQQQLDQASKPDIGSLVGSVAGAAMMFSDARLKSDIVRIGTHPRGVGIYRYRIFGRPEVGVLAQELAVVAPDLVARHPSGYLMVNYGGL